mgnify:CR=1 FL=1
MLSSIDSFQNHVQQESYLESVEFATELLEDLTSLLQCLAQHLERCLVCSSLSMGLFCTTIIIVVANSNNNKCNKIHTNQGTLTFFIRGIHCDFGTVEKHFIEFGNSAFPL